VQYLAAWEPPEDIGARFPNLKLRFPTGPGIDQFDLAALPRDLPVVRMIEPGIVGGMVEYVTHAVLDLHRDMPAYRRGQQRLDWQPPPVKTAGERRVGVLGLCSLGQAVLVRLVALGFDCAGWSRAQHAIDGVRCFAGDDGQAGFLERTEILVCLLPLTAETRSFLNGNLFARLPQGAALVHVGRGAQLVVPDILSALDSGRISEVVLDVTEPEPLPAEHPLWSHERVRITPHIASVTQPVTAARVVLENLRRFARGEALVGLVDRARGY
jgi:glyoxylate/hydroxypyruvate reductase A